MPNYIANPPPYLGQNDSVPIAVLKGPYCQKLVNCNVKNGKISLRKANSSFYTPAQSFMGMAPYRTGAQLLATEKQGGANALRVMDVTSGGAGTLLYNPVIANTFTFTTFNEFAGSFYIWGDNSLTTAGGAYYNSSTSTWGLAPYTLPANFTPGQSIGFKRRHYILKYQGTIVAMGGLDAITGALTTRDFASVLTLGGYCHAVKSVSLSDNLSAEKYFVLISNQGEVLAYKGAFIDSSDWELVGNYYIPPPLGAQSFIDYRGDVLVITEAGLFSLRDLFLRGSQTLEDIAISAPIKNRWNQIIAGFSAHASSLAVTSGVYDQTNNRILILFKYSVDFDTGLIGIVGGNGADRWLIYDINARSWMEHGEGGIGDNGGTVPVFFNKNVYFALSALVIYKKEGTTGSNPYSGVGFTIRSAPMDIGKFGVNRGCGVELLMAADAGVYSTLSAKLILDLGREETTSVTDSDPGSNGGVVKNLYDVGGEASYVQYEISGSATTGSVGFDFYGTNYWNLQGEAPR